MDETAPAVEHRLEEADSEEGSERTRVLPGLILELPYIPDFLLGELRFYFAPSLESPKAVYHTLVGPSADTWSGYYITKKGVSFFRSDAPADGPFRVDPDDMRLVLLEPGRLLAPKPRVRLEESGDPIPLLSLEKHRPINPWKPNYIQALNFIRKYEWPHPVDRRVQLAIWEIEECGQVAGSVSWRNGEKILLDSDSEALRETLVDVFYHRPEDFELGSSVYLRVLCQLGSGGWGYRKLHDLAAHPITKKRRSVARALGEMSSPLGLPTLLLLLGDEDFGVRDAALEALVTVGVDPSHDPEGRVRAFLESDDIRHRVWASAALFRGGDESFRKDLVQWVKDEPRPLADLGELGEICVRLDLIDAVPFLIKRFKSDNDEIAIDAGETLARFTGIPLEYNVVGDSAARGAALRALNAWWEEKKKQRRGGR